MNRDHDDFAEAVTPKDTLRILDGLDRKTAKRIATNLRTYAKELPGLTLTESVTAVDHHLTKLERRAIAKRNRAFNADFSLFPIVISIGGLLVVTIYAILILHSLMISG